MGGGAARLKRLADTYAMTPFNAFFPQMERPQARVRRRPPGQRGPVHGRVGRDAGGGRFGGAHLLLHHRQSVQSIDGRR